VEEKETDRILRRRRARGPHASPTLPTWESWGKWAACDPHVANTHFFLFYLLFNLKIGLIINSIINIIL
jgi:hypothetical protein